VRKAFYTSVKNISAVGLIWLHHNLSVNIINVLLQV